MTNTKKYIEVKDYDGYDEITLKGSERFIIYMVLIFLAWGGTWYIITQSIIFALGISLLMAIGVDIMILIEKIIDKKKRKRR